MKRLAATGDAQPGGSALSALLSPLTPASFFADYWDRQCVHIAGEVGRFRDIITDADFCDAIFAAYLGDRRLNYMQKSLGGKQQSQDFFLRQKAQWQAAPKLAQLAEQFRTGTLVFELIQNRIATTKSWCRRLYPDLNCQISTNAYFSAGRDASAFDVHFDEQDVFILQLEGEKEWRLWDRARVVNPIAGFQADDEQEPPDLPADAVVRMTEGDVLYVPRGTWHWPRSLDNQPSLHLTLTLIMPKASDILYWLKQRLCEDDDIRAALPFSPHQPGEPSGDPALARAFDRLQQLIADPRRDQLAVAHMALQNMRSVIDNPGAADARDEED